MLSMAKIRKCVYPYPVYEAHFADNTSVRMSVWQPLGKPWDYESFRRCLSKNGRREIVDGHLEFSPIGQPSARVQDPLFSGETVAPIRKRAATAKQVKTVLQELLEYLDGGNDEAALTRARELLAA